MIKIKAGDIYIYDKHLKQLKEKQLPYVHKYLDSDSFYQLASKMEEQRI